MADEFDDLILDALDEFRVTEAVVPMAIGGQNAVRATVARRRRVRITTLSVLGALAVAVPIAAFAASPHGNNSPPVAATQTPPPSPTPSPSQPAPPPLSPEELKAAMLAAKPKFPNGSPCPNGSGELRDGGRTTFVDGKDAHIFQVTTGHLKGDSSEQIVLKVSCAPANTAGEFHSDFAVAFDHTADGGFAGLGVVVTAKPGEVINTVAVAGSKVVATFGVDNYGVEPPDTRTQIREFTWDGSKFTQTAGPTEFPSLATPGFDLELTVANMVASELGECRYVDGVMTLERKGTVLVTVRNNSLQKSAPFSVMLDGSRATYPFEVDEPSWVYEKGKTSQTHPGLDPGESIQLTVSISAATCFAEWPIDATLTAENDTNPGNNIATPKL